MYDFGLRLQELRKKRKLSQSQVAEKLELHPGTISAYENNATIPSVPILSSLALLYNTTTDYILGHNHNEILNIDGLTDRQKEIISTLLMEFKEQKTP